MIIIIKDNCGGLVFSILRVFLLYFSFRFSVNLVAETLFFFSGHCIPAQTRWLSAPHRKEKLVLSDPNTANTFLPCEYVVHFCLKKNIYTHFFKIHYLIIYLLHFRLHEVR